MNDMWVAVLAQALHSCTLCELCGLPLIM